MGSKKGAILTVISALVALIVAMATIQSTQASIDFWLQKPDSLTPGLNSITLYCKNGGGMDGDFYLTVKFINAAFSTQTNMPYTQVDESTVKVKFVLHKDDSSEKTLYFTTNQTDPVTIQLTLERTTLLQFLKANDLYPTHLTYTWNPQLQVYNCTNSQ